MRRLAWIGVFLIGGSLPALAAVGFGTASLVIATYGRAGNNPNRAVQLIFECRHRGLFSGIDLPGVPA